VLSGGGDPGALLARHPGRFGLLHLKDVRAVEEANHRRFQSSWTELGSGVADWPAILAAAEAGGCRYYYLEQEPPFRGEPIDSVAESVAYLDRLAQALRAASTQPTGSNVHA